MSIVLNIDSKSTGTTTPEDFTIKYTDLQLNKDKRQEVALLHAYIWYSWYNISAANGNNKFRYHNGTTWSSELTIPDGAYSIDQLNTYISGVIDNAGDSSANLQLSANYSTLKCDIAINNSYQLDLQSSLSSLHSLLGFTSKIVTVSESGTSNVDITNGVNSLNIHCSLVDTSHTFKNGNKDDTIMSFSPQSGPGTLLSVDVTHLTYIPINTSGSINSIRMRITDQSGNAIPLNGEHVTYRMEIRDIREDRSSIE